MASPSTVDSPNEQPSNPLRTESIPACITRDNLSSPYFPQTSRSQLAAVVVLGLVFLAVSIHRLNHTDLWGHMNFGRWIVTHGVLPESDPFSCDPIVGSFVNVPWLAQVTGYLTFRTLGPEGLVLGHALLFAVACGLTMWAITRRGVELPWAVCGGAAVFILSLPAIGTIRPQLFGMLGVPIVLAGLAAMHGKSIDRLDSSAPSTHRRRWPWMLAFAPLFALWSNLHGSFAIGLVLIGLYAVTETIAAAMKGRSPRDIPTDSDVSRGWGLLLVAVAGSCVNPIGVWLLLEVATFGGHTPLESITEWQTLTPWSLSGALFFGSLALLVGLVRKGGLKLTLFEMLTLAVFGLLTLSAMRMLIWWALVWPWIAAPHAAAAWHALRKSQPDSAREASTPKDASMRTLIAMAFVFMTLLLAPPTHALISSQPRGSIRVLREGTPIYLAETLRQRGIEGSMLAPMDWADYLVWTTNQKLRPLVYSHVHLTSSDNWQVYRRIAAGDPEWHELAATHGLDLLVVDRQRSPRLARMTFDNAFSSQPDVHVVYQDQRCLVVRLLNHASAEDSNT